MNVSDVVKVKNVQLVIPGTYEGNFYKIAYANEKGCVGVKRDNYLGSDSETRVRCILWDVQNGKEASGNYDELIEKGWERKYNNHHTSKHISESGEEREAAIQQRVKEAVMFLNQETIQADIDICLANMKSKATECVVNKYLN